jgi:hypothetical protein
MTTIDWDDLAARFRLAEQVGLHRYNELHLAYRRRSVIAAVGGHDIRPINTRFGRLFSVGDTGRAFSTQAQAEAYARKHPLRSSGAPRERKAPGRCDRASSARKPAAPAP